MSSELATVSDCSAAQYCTASDQALNYGGQYIVHWNNKFSPLNSQSLVTVSVYSTYDLTTPIFQRTNIDNENGMISLQPDAQWFSRYTGSSSAAGENQTIFFAVYLQGNDPPAANQMLQLNLTATPEQYQQIQQILHPSTTASASASASSASASDSASDAARSSSTGASSSDSQTQTDTASDAASQTDTDSDLQSNDDSTLEMELLSSGELRTDISSALESSSDADGNGSGGDKRGLSDGAIAGIAVGSAVGFLLLLLLVLLPLYLRRRRSKRLLTKTGGGGGSEESASSEQEVPAMAMALPAAARRTGDAEKRQHLDTPLLVGNRPNNSFTSHDDASTYQPLSLESPRVLVHMPSSTRSAVAGAAGSPGPDAGSPGPADAGLSTDDARQIGDIFRDALRKPPPISDDDDDLHDDDPGWRERVANERMQRELEQEASVIRSVAMRAQGSGDLSSSKSSP
ncbi:hypothetical protein H4217_004339 [Coemansia sp. RSA 1939]|nr:hypothetical protein H4217_004339 [Coemansia sp. RSA 1939]KAJ2606576.1 hypothetical protein EV177_005891 [Coemansia sp. RSA 1804]KAJ2692519.1 hypothetical protein GGH99_001679 [Coemansia sp. RSA 1285]